MVAVHPGLFINQKNILMPFSARITQLLLWLKSALLKYSTSSDKKSYFLI